MTLVILKPKVLTNLKVYYYLPDYNSILQEFWWQLLDQPPRFPRIYKFLDCWQKDIDAVIHSIEVSIRNDKY